eukprot:g6707.t1
MEMDIDHQFNLDLDVIEETRAAVAAIESGDAAKVNKFLQHLLPVSAKTEGPGFKCMRRAVSLLNTPWKAEDERKRTATFSSEDKRMVDAVLMGRSICRRTRSQTCFLPRSGVKLGSFANLAQAAGSPEAPTHLDLRYCMGIRKIDFAALAKALPNLKGLAVAGVFNSDDGVRGRLRQLTDLVRTVKLESLQLVAEEWDSAITIQESAITDGVLEDLAYVSRIPILPFFFMPGILDVAGSGGGSGSDDPSTLHKLWLSTTAEGPSITAGMAAIGANMPHLEALVVDRLGVTDDGWRKFAIARADTAAASSSDDAIGGGSGTGDRNRIFPPLNMLRHMRQTALRQGRRPHPFGENENENGNENENQPGEGCLRADSILIGASGWHNCGASDLHAYHAMDQTNSTA